MSTHVWQRLVTHRPDTQRRILCAYRAAGGEWIMFASIYYPDIHRVYLNRDEWLGDEIKRHDVYWAELPPPPEVSARSASASEGTC